MLNFAKLLPNNVVGEIRPKGLETMGLSPRSPQMVRVLYQLSPSSILIQTESIWSERG